MTRDEARELLETPISEGELARMEMAAASGSDPEPQIESRRLISALWMDIYRLVKEVRRLRKLTGGT